MMQQAFEIVATNSPSISLYVANAPPQELEDAVEAHDQATHRHETRNTNPDTDLPPEATPEPVPELILPVNPTIFIPLYRDGTQVVIGVSPDPASEPGQQPPFLTVIPSPGFSVSSFNGRPIPVQAPVAAPGFADPDLAPGFPSEFNDLNEFVNFDEATATGG